MRLVLIVLLALIWGPVHAGQKEDQRANEAVRVLTEIQNIPESAIPDKLLDEAQAIVVVPNVLKAGFMLGGRGGRGLIALKSADGTWSNPSFVTLAGGSFGFQAGLQFADVVLVFRNSRSLESIVNGKLTLGADAAVAAGPVGRNAAVATDGQFQAEIWSWSRARGLFAGIALDGAVLKIDHKSNQSVYGRGSTTRMIFEGRAVGTPSRAVAHFRERLQEAANVARMVRSKGAGPAASNPAPAPATVPPATFTPVEDNPVRSEPLNDRPLDGTPGVGAIFHKSMRNGAKRTIPTLSLTSQSPTIQPIHGSGSPANAMVQNNAVSSVALHVVATLGARHQWPWRRRSNTVISRSCEQINAVHEASAIRGVATQIESTTATANPTHATLRAERGPNRRLMRLLTRNASG